MTGQTGGGHMGVQLTVDRPDEPEVCTIGNLMENPCFAKAEPSEPLFPIMGRDPVAAETLRFWADKREERLSRAVGSFTIPHSEAMHERDKIAHARQTADLMYVWHWENRVR